MVGLRNIRLICPKCQKTYKGNIAVDDFNDKRILHIEGALDSEMIDCLNTCPKCSSVNRLSIKVEDDIIIDKIKINAIV